MAALAGYRRLLRTANVVFKNDVFAVTQAKVQLRAEFLKQKDVTDKAELTELFKGIDDVDEMLRFNIVQGTLNERGNYDMKITEENQVTVGANQDLPGGAQLEPVDASRVGGEVTVEKVQNRK
jgi:hypothetical protein